MKKDFNQLLEKYKLTEEEKVVMLAYFHDYLKKRALKKIENELGEDDWLELGQFLRQKADVFLDEVKAKSGQDLALLISQEREDLFKKFQVLLKKNSQFGKAVIKRDWKRVIEFFRA